MNLTITVDDELLKKARIQALQEDTSVNALVREFLETYVGSNNERRRAIAELLKLSRECSSGRGDAHWTRDELYER